MVGKVYGGSLPQQFGFFFVRFWGPARHLAGRPPPHMKFLDTVDRLWGSRVASPSNDNFGWSWPELNVCLSLPLEAGGDGGWRICMCQVAAGPNAIFHHCPEHLCPAPNVRLPLKCCVSKYNRTLVAKLSAKLFEWVSLSIRVSARQKSQTHAKKG